ncbi:MAG: hypothetical protein GY946_29995 [bacterium]|nr:hypothetical protein [bacterium]
MKREWWVPILVVGVLGAFFATTQLHDSEPDVDMTDMGPLEIREDTTRLLEPVVGGLIDYARVLNDRPVPAAVDNAALPFLRVLGTGALGGDAAQVSRRLGVPGDVTAEGIFVPASEEVTEQLNATDISERGDNELIGAWIARNQAALDTIVAASGRAHFWSSVVRNEEVGLLIPALSADRLVVVTNALATRAEIARAGGRLQDGWRDAGALLRLYALLEEEPGLLSRIVSASVHRTAMEWLQRLLEENRPDEALAAAIIERLASVRTVRTLEGDLDRYERYMILDALIRNAGGATVPGLNPMLRTINRAFDDALALFEDGYAELPERVEIFVEDRQAQARALSRELGGTAGKMRAVTEVVASRGASASRVSGEIVATTALWPLRLVVDTLRELEVQRLTLLQAAGLRLHRLRSGSYPASLDELVPATIPALPELRFGTPVVSYERTDDGCRVGDEDLVVELAR